MSNNSSEQKNFVISNISILQDFLADKGHNRFSFLRASSPDHAFFKLVFILAKRFHFLPKPKAVKERKLFEKFQQFCNKLGSKRTDKTRKKFIVSSSRLIRAFISYMLIEADEPVKTDT